MHKRLAILLLIFLGTGLAATSYAWMPATAARASYQDYYYAWGNAADGRLGTNTTFQNSTPKMITASPYRGWTKVDGGDDHACGIAGGVAYCWGLGTSGRLGTNNTSSYDEPELVQGGITGWTHITAAKDHTCGIAGGVAYCWGNNTSGGLGRGNTGGTAITPSVVLGGWTDWTDISNGDSYSCGVRSTGEGYCWGESSNGRLGNGNSSTDRVSPSLISGGHSWSKVVAGSYSSACGITTTGTMYCWGENGSGQVGDNATTDRPTPTLQSGTSGWTWKDVSVGSDYACAIRSDSPNDGKLYCWGNNSWGRKSNNSNNKYPEEASANNGSGSSYNDWVQVSALSNHTCGIQASGRLSCWGNQNYGKLGDNTNSTFGQGNLLGTPVDLTNGDYSWVWVSVSPDSTYAIRRDRNIDPSTGSSGIGSNRSTLAPPGFWWF